LVIIGSYAFEVNYFFCFLTKKEIRRQKLRRKRPKEKRHPPKIIAAITVLFYHKIKHSMIACFSGHKSKEVSTAFTAMETSS
jgi:hypothetical protein